MPTSATTMKLPLELKRRIEPLARKSGKSPHAWMIEALEREATLSELREGILDQAEEAASELDRGGALYSAEDVHAYIRARATGKKAKKPSAIGRKQQG
jgi:predicted transcriptional regulator